MPLFIVFGSAGSCVGQQILQAQAVPIQITVVRGAPFSAEVVVESTQGLADGSRIVRKTTAALLRDGQGRSRREQNLSEIQASPGGTGSIVFIQDPVTMASYILETATRSARKVVGPKPASPESSAAAKDVDAQETGAKREPLGNGVIDGILVEGRRITRIIPAGEVGNERPLEIVSESWYSPELQTIITSKTFDPRLGQTLYALKNVMRGEPDPALFEVPADFKILAEPQALADLNRPTNNLEAKANNMRQVGAQEQK
jgi:hypothetical protein